MVNTMSHCEGNMDYYSSMMLGYASMLMAFSLVSVGIINYRNEWNNGVITFKKSFQIGMMIVIIASTIYVLAWLIDFFYFIPDFMEKYAAKAQEKLRSSGTKPEELEKQAKEMTYYVKLYKNPLFNALMTYMEILPVGLVVTLVSSFILKRKPQA